MLPKRVTLREVGPREGFQTLDAVVPTASKLELIRLLSLTGVSTIEVTSFVRPDKVPQMADAEELVKLLEPREGVRYTALYLNKAGFNRAEATGKLDNRGWLYTSPSETFLKKNAATSRTGVIESIPAWIEIFTSSGKKLEGIMISMGFGCTYEGEISPTEVLECVSEVISTLVSLGHAPGEICLADTVGMANPLSIRNTVDACRTRFPNIPVTLHLHDTRGTGMANVYAGLEEGVELFETSVGGLGGCPFASGAAGNVPTEDVAYLCASLGIESGVNLELYVEASRYAEQIAGKVLPGKYAKSGGTRK